MDENLEKPLWLRKPPYSLGLGIINQYRIGIIYWSVFWTIGIYPVHDGDMISIPHENPCFDHGYAKCWSNLVESSIILPSWPDPEITGRNMLVGMVNLGQTCWDPDCVSPNLQNPTSPNSMGWRSSNSWGKCWGNVNRAAIIVLGWPPHAMFNSQFFVDFISNFPQGGAPGELVFMMSTTIVRAYDRLTQFN